jgi:hypothetical protein
MKILNIWLYKEKAVKNAVEGIFYLSHLLIF